MANSTMVKFGYPDTLVKELDHWAILVRPAQVTLGSLVLAAKDESTDFSKLPAGAFAELGTAVGMIEPALAQCCDYERINYLMLMMVDPHVHFHVIPRYSRSRSWKNFEFPDEGWPGPPNLKAAVELAPEDLKLLRNHLNARFERV